MEVTSAQSTPAMPDITTIAYRVTLNFFAIILLIAAGLKARAILSQAGSMDAVKIGWTEIAVEWLLAYWTLTGLAAILARRVTIAILIIFIAVAAWRVFHGQPDCGCFGNVHVHPQVTLALDSIVLIAIGWLGRQPKDLMIGSTSLPQIFAATMIAISIPTILFAMTRTLGQLTIVLDPSSWIGKPLPLLAAIDNPADRTRLSTGHWTLILMDHHCDRCVQLLFRLELALRHNPRGIAIGVIDFSPSEPGYRPPGEFREMHLRQGVVYIANLPVEVSLDSSVVESVRQLE